MSVSRTPRKWDKGDEEPPADVTRLRRPEPGDGDVVRLGIGWWFVEEGQPIGQATKRKDGWRWSANTHWPLMEVPSDDRGVWVFNGHDMGGVPQWSWDPSPCREFVPPAQQPQGPTNPPSLVSVDTGTPIQDDSGQLRAWTKKVYMVLLSFYGEHATADQQDHVASMTRAIVEDASPVAAGWRPPLPAEDLVGSLHVNSDDGPWYVRILDEQVHHTTEEAPSLIDWTADGRMIGVELLGSGRERPPLPADETEWEWGYTVPQFDDVSVAISEDEARRRVAFSAPGRRTLQRRRVGEWEVTQ